ncbi:MAG: DUF6320 domain-containing protein [Spirochaetales bacterium]
MAYCYRCGVKLEDDATSCPLCGASVPDDARPAPREPWPRNDAGDTANYPTTLDARRLLAKQILLVVFITPALTLAVLGLLLPQTGSWIVYSIAALTVVWAFSTLPLVAWGRPILIAASEVGVAIGGLVLFDALDGDLSWSLVIGVPVVVLAGATASVVTVAIMRMSEHGANVAATIIAGVAVVVVGLDMITGCYLTGSLVPGWSLVVVAALSPVGGFLIYYHRSLRKRIPLGRRFHV